MSQVAVPISIMAMPIMAIGPVRESRASIGGGGGTRPPHFSVWGGQHRNCPPHFLVQKNCEVYSLTQHASLLKACSVHRTT